MDTSCQELALYLSKLLKSPPLKAMSIMRNADKKARTLRERKPRSSVCRIAKCNADSLPLCFITQSPLLAPPNVSFNTW